MGKQSWNVNILSFSLLLQILIGAVIAMGSADRDGRLHPGDELVYVDGIPVAGKTHRYVIDLMHHAARNGQVNLTVRRKVLCGGVWLKPAGRLGGQVVKCFCGTW